MYKFNDANLGEFTERDFSKAFTYRLTDKAWALENNLPHEIDVLDGTRSARVLKTVVYVAVDEDANGKPVLEKWHIKNHVVFNKPT